jgi:hypothetical protein
MTFIFFLATSPLIFNVTDAKALLAFIFVLIVHLPKPQEQDKGVERPWIEIPPSPLVQSGTNRLSEENSTFCTYEAFHLLYPVLDDLQILCSPGPSLSF